MNLSANNVAVRLNNNLDENGNAFAATYAVIDGGTNILNWFNGKPCM